MQHFPLSLKTKLTTKFILISSLVFGLLLRLLWLNSQTPFFSDQDWFYKSAVSALLTGNSPLLGITASVTWLHQGPIWTYLLIPGLVISNFHPLSGVIINIVFSFFTILLCYSVGQSYFSRYFGLISSFVYSFFFFSIVHSRIAYDTSPIPLFTLIVFHLISKRQFFMSGLFLGFLYQLHLLTFIFWPLVIYLVYKKSDQPFTYLLGFLVGILPFLISGPVQTFGIFAWLGRFLFGAASSSGLSVSYQVVLLIPFVFILSKLFSVIPKSFILLAAMSFILINLLILFSTRYLTIFPSYQPTLSDQYQRARLCQLDTSGYLFWWWEKTEKSRCIMK